MSNIDYTPPGSLVGFLTSDNFIALQCGPVGGGKTTAGLIKIARYAKMMAPCTDGVRRSRIAWVRRSRQMLYDTSIKDFLSWYPDEVAGTFHKTESRFVMRFDDVECEVLFRPMEDASDVNRLLSLQLSAAVIDEYREVDKVVFEGLLGRLGRYPDKRLVPHRPEWGLDKNGHPVGGCVRDDGAAHAQMWGMTNPPDADTFWEEMMVDPPSNVDVFIQPSALSPEADWLQYLPADYYDNLANGRSKDWIDVYIHNKFGRSLAGKPVFESFNLATHTTKDMLNVLHGQTVLIGVDAGLTPAAVLGQVAYDSRLVVHSALTSDGMGALRFIREKLKPVLANKFPRHKSQIVIDPAAMQRAQTDERTVYDIYKQEGFDIIVAPTNALAARLAAVETYLTSTIEGGKSKVIIGPDAQPLVTALNGKYAYKIDKKGATNDTPEKTHPWSDVADGFQYLCLHASGGAFMGRNVSSTARREVKPIKYRYV